MTPVSVVVITFNEEEHCTMSRLCQDIADEIVIVDSFSKDRTKICLSYGAKFIEHKFDGTLNKRISQLRRQNITHPFT